MSGNNKRRKNSCNSKEKDFPLSDNDFSPDNQDKMNSDSKKRRKVNSPRKKNKGKSRKDVKFDISAKDLAESGTSSENQEQGDRRIAKYKEVTEPPPQLSTDEGVTVTFCEDENDFVTMNVNDQEFDSNNGESEEDEEMEDGEISFNNNASTIRSRSDRTPPVQEPTKRKESEEDREIRIVNKTVERLQKIMAAGGYFKQNVSKDIPKPPGKSNSPTKSKSFKEVSNGNGNEPVKLTDSNSESTIYQGAVNPASKPITIQQVQAALDSVNQGENLNGEIIVGVSGSSDDDLVDTSGESVPEQISNYLDNARQSIHFDVSEERRMEPPSRHQDRQGQRVLGGRVRSEIHVPQATFRNNRPNIPPEQPSMEEEVSKMIREAEANKASRIVDPQGMSRFLGQPQEVSERVNERNVDQANLTQMDGFNSGQPGNMVLFAPNQFVRTAMMDEDYLIVAAHVDESLERRIRNGEYIDFARLLPRDRVQMQQDNRIELINQNGHLSCTTVSNNGSHGEFSIGSFARWEQAFRVFSNIYTRQYPQRAAELIQYNHVIHTASMSYHWSNVYAYDIDFRLHMSRHPQRSWSVILQQAWNLRLKDRHENNDRRLCGHASSGGSGSSSKRKDICFRFNVGKCTYGARCKFDHRCGICGKLGHGAHNCRRVNDWPHDKHDKKYDWKDQGDRKRDRDHRPPGSATTA